MVKQIPTYKKTVLLPVYNCKLTLYVTPSLNKIVNKICKNHKMGYEFIDEAEGVVLSPDITDYYLVIDSKYLSYNTIAHELYHATVKITEDRDITDEETQAWLCGHISGVLHKFIDKKNLKVKHGE
jgi:hypothetical protein